MAVHVDMLARPADHERALHHADVEQVEPLGIAARMDRESIPCVNVDLGRCGEIDLVEAAIGEVALRRAGGRGRA